MSVPSRSTPLISVALCTFNGARYLREQLDSVLAQTEVTIEVVAVDDGSQDATRAILQEFAAREPRIRWHGNERNLGPTASFERAMSLCKGEFIAPCDQDDIWHRDKLVRLLAAIDGCDLAYCDSEYVDADGQALRRRVSDDRTMLAGTAPTAFLFANSVSGHASLLRRELFDRARPFPNRVYHDWWLALCAAGGNGVGYLDRPLVRFRRHADAYSPMGKSAAAARDAIASRAWLEQRHCLLQAYSRSRFRDNEIALTLANALRRAIDLGRNDALMRLLWRHRRGLPRWNGIPALDALRLQALFLRKLHRARRGRVGENPRAD